MYCTQYLIAGTGLRIFTAWRLRDNAAFGLYRTDGFPAGTRVFDIRFERSGDMPVFEENELVDAAVLDRIYERDGLRTRVFSVPWVRDGVVWCRDAAPEPGTTVRLSYNAAMEAYLSETTACFNALGLENILQADGKFIFHCCFVHAEGGAVLFTAPSGGGKSTQGRLWEQSGCGVVINGDRAVLDRQADGRWYAHGLPLAGSSDIFRNEAYPLRAIIGVKKAAENRIAKLTGAAAFTTVYGQLLTHSRDEAFQLAVMQAAEEIVAAVPVCRMECRPDADAVRTARDFISGL